jgi:malate dehydrogenase (quinone)
VLEVVQTCFPQLLATPEGQACMKAMIPSYNEDLRDPKLAARYAPDSRAVEIILQLK